MEDQKPSSVDSMVSITTEYISVGGNRHPAAADWDVQSGILAYGADTNVALWDPLVCGLRKLAPFFFSFGPRF